MSRGCCGGKPRPRQLSHSWDPDRQRGHGAPPPVVLHEVLHTPEVEVSPAVRFAPSGASRGEEEQCHAAPRDAMQHRATPCISCTPNHTSTRVAHPRLKERGAQAALCTPGRLQCPVPIPSQALAAAPFWFSLPSSEPNTNSLIWNNSRVSAKGKNPALALFLS